MGQFLVLATFYSDENDEKMKLAEIYTFYTIFGSGNQIFGQKYIGDGLNFQTIRDNFFLPFF